MRHSMVNRPKINRIQWVDSRIWDGQHPIPARPVRFIKGAVSD